MCIQRDIDDYISPDITLKVASMSKMTEVPLSGLRTRKICFQTCPWRSLGNPSSKMYLGGLLAAQRSEGNKFVCIAFIFYILLVCFAAFG